MKEGQPLPCTPQGEFFLLLEEIALLVLLRTDGLEWARTWDFDGAAEELAQLSVFAMPLKATQA